jgi:hypothetical protein
MDAGRTRWPFRPWWKPRAEPTRSLASAKT